MIWGANFGVKHELKTGVSIGVENGLKNGVNLVLLFFFGKQTKQSTEKSTARSTACHIHYFRNPLHATPTTNCLGGSGAVWRSVEGAEPGRGLSGEEVGPGEDRSRGGPSGGRGGEGEGGFIFVRFRARVRTHIDWEGRGGPPQPELAFLGEGGGEREPYCQRQC